MAPEAKRKSWKFWSRVGQGTSDPSHDDFNSDDYLYRLAETILTFDATCPKPPASGSSAQREFLKIYKECEGHQTIETLPVFLKGRPKLQERLSFLVNYTPSRWVVEQEIPELKALRTLRWQAFDSHTDYKKNPYKWMHDSHVKGLCFSGGGIRSATFNLGILQGLTDGPGGKNFLESVDYLSSVSGGGYIHEWLAAWIKREKSLKQVEEQLTPLPEAGCPPFHPAPLRWLRRYSNYLTPQTGFFTADTWVVAAIWLRNTFLNQLILVSALFFLVLLPHVLAPSAELKKLLTTPSAANTTSCVSTAADGSVDTSWEPQILTRAISLSCELLSYVKAESEIVAAIVFRWLNEPLLFAGVSLLLFAIAVIIMTVSLRAARLYGAAGCTEARRHQSTGGGNGTAKAVVILMLMSALFMSRYVMMTGPWGVCSSAVYYSVFAVILITNIAIACAGGADQAFVALSGYDATNATRWINFKIWMQKYVGLIGIFSAIAAAAATGLFALIQGFLSSVLTHWFAAQDLEGIDVDLWKLALVIGPPLFLTVPFFSQVMLAGLIGRDFADWLREWLARIRAWSLIVGTAWGAWFAIALLTRPIIDLTWNTIVSNHPSIKWSALVTWVATTLGGVVAGKSPKTNGNPQNAKATSSALNILAIVGPYVFIAGLLVLLAWLPTTQSLLPIASLHGYTFTLSPSAYLLCSAGGSTSTSSR